MTVKKKSQPKTTAKKETKQRVSFTANPVKVPADPSDGYGDFESVIRQTVAGLGNRSLFHTNADPELLWKAYLTNIPKDRRQHYAN